MCRLSALSSFKVKFLMIIMPFKLHMLLIFLMLILMFHANEKHIKRSHQSDPIIIFINYYKFLLEISNKLLSNPSTVMSIKRLN